MPELGVGLLLGAMLFPPGVAADMDVSEIADHPDNKGVDQVLVECGGPDAGIVMNYTIDEDYRIVVEQGETDRSISNMCREKSG